MSALPPETDGVLARMPSERRCLRCGCVKARHPAGYCVFHGPERCKRYRGWRGVILTVGWIAALIIWLFVLIQSYRASHS